MLSHTKTVVILGIGWVEGRRNPDINIWRQVGGSICAVSGMVAYQWRATSLATRKLDGDQEQVDDRAELPADELKVAGTRLSERDAEAN